MVLEILLPWIKKFIVDFSYIAIFSVSAVSSSTIFIPFPIYLVIFFASGLGLNPLVTGIAAGIGSAVGELTGYFIGAGGRYLAEEKKKTLSSYLLKFGKIFKKYGFATIIVTSFLPFPFDIVGILSGIGKYDIKKFFIGTAIGKTLRMLLIAYSGHLLIPYAEVFIQSLF
jgi:membrane protein YqaA with SNARE-associated domain